MKADLGYKMWPVSQPMQNYLIESVFVNLCSVVINNLDRKNGSKVRFRIT